MEEPKKVIRIIGFQGIGTGYPQYAKEDPLIWYGHVGIQFEDDLVIYGFHPTEQTIEAIGGLEGFRSRMKNRIPVPAIIQDDTKVFHRAYELTPTRPPLTGVDRNRLVVYVIGYSFEANRFAAIYDELRSWYNQQTEHPYRFPPITENDSFDNCATVQRQIGIPVAALKNHMGDMGEYMRFFVDAGDPWHPE